MRKQVGPESKQLRCRSFDWNIPLTLWRAAEVGAGYASAGSNALLGQH
jgi:hypothetical protein